MTKRKGFVKWPIWPLLVMAGVVILSAFLSLPSMLFPYIASHRYVWFCHYVLAPSSFILVFASLLCSAYVNRHIEAIRSISLGSTLLRCTVGGAFISVPWAFMFMLIVPAIPSELFAERAVSIPVKFDHLESFRGVYGYHIWIYFSTSNDSGRFMWHSSDPIIRTIKHGSCVVLHAREWPLGAYVDAISESSTC
jgi:hypothetical protein